MTQQQLHGAEIDAALDEMGGKTMAQRVTTDAAHLTDAPLPLWDRPQVAS